MNFLGAWMQFNWNKKFFLCSMINFLTYNTCIHKNGYNVEMKFNVRSLMSMPKLSDSAQGLICVLRFSTSFRVGQ